MGYYRISKMVNPEVKITTPEELYAATLAEFERKKQEILIANQTSTSPLPFWKKLFRTKDLQKSIGLEEQLLELEKEFFSQLYSNRKLLVCHLKANPNRKEEIITSYLQSPELLKDTNTLGRFFSFWLLEFFQKVDTGTIKNLYQFIKNSKQKFLPREIHEARRKIFEPIFTLLNGREKEAFKNINELGIFGVGQKLAELLIETNQPLPNSLKEEYQNYVNQLIRIEGGITPLGPAEPEPKKPKTKKPKEKVAKIFIPPTTEVKTQPPPPPETLSFSFWIILGPKSEPIKIESLEELAKVMKKIKGLGPITPQDIWRRLKEISSTAQNPHLILQRYGERVAGGKFEGWYESRIGKQWLIIFNITDQKIIFRVGPHEDVYATRRRKPPDRARSL